MKKNKIKRFFSLVMSIMIFLMSFSATAFAEEISSENGEVTVVSVEQLEDGKTRTTYEFEITPENIEEEGIMPYTNDYYVSLIRPSIKGQDMQFSGNYISYRMTVTASDGSAVDKSVSIQLWDYEHAGLLQEHIVKANGITVMEPQYAITPNRTYYFKYYLSSGRTPNLRIRMVIDTWS